MLLPVFVISCREKTPEYVRTPVIEMNFNSFYQDGVLMDIRSINTDAVYALALKVGDPDPKMSVSPSGKPPRNRAKE